MTQHHPDLTLRPIAGPDEIELFNRLPYVLNTEVAGDLGTGRRHLHWLWVALDGDRLVARAGFWSPPGADTPMFIDIFDIADGSDETGGDRTDGTGGDRDAGRDAGARLLAAALATLPNRPEYTRFVPPDWRDDSVTRRGVEDRMAVLEGLGAELFVERLRLHWEPGTPIPEPTGRLTFHPVDEPDDLVALMTDVMSGTLDAHGRADLTRMSAAEAARVQYEEELASYPSPAGWWRIARRPDGTPVGFVIPAHNGYNPIIAYIGVVPAMRGNGYIDEILAEGTRILAAQDVPRVRAATDLGNVPMARAFARAGYVVFERQIDMVWPAEEVP